MLDILLSLNPDGFDVLNLSYVKLLVLSHIPLQRSLLYTLLQL